MPSFDVEIRDLHGQVVLARRRVPAHSERWAIADTERYLPPGSGDLVVNCYRRRRLRPRRFAVARYLPAGGPEGGGPDGDGLAGVREPRRPKPGPGQLYAAADLPGEPDPTLLYAEAETHGEPDPVG